MASITAALAVAVAGAASGAWQDSWYDEYAYRDAADQQGAHRRPALPDHAPKTVRNFVDLAEGSREWTNPVTRRL